MLKMGKILYLDSATRFWYPNAVEVALDKRDDSMWDEMLKSPTDNFIKIMSLADDIAAMTPGWQAHYTLVEEKHWLPLLQPCLMSVCWMHVKNIKLDKHAPAPALVKKSKKRGRVTPCTYHTLEIQPFKKTLERDSPGLKTGIRNALHMVRGSFHHYGSDFGKGKLFGKYQGTFWVPAHLRGNIDSGLVDKGYTMTSPHTEEGKINLQGIEEVTERFKHVCG